MFGTSALFSLTCMAAEQASMQNCGETVVEEENSTIKVARKFSLQLKRIEMCV